MNILEQWEFGYMSVAGLLFFPLLYLIVWQIRKFTAWTTREQGPKERALVFVIVLGLLGVFVGGLSQSFVDLGVACKKTGEKIIPCVTERSMRHH